jgi:hypothetical protein
MIFFMFVLIRSVPDGDDGRSFSGPIHGSAVADRGTPLARVMHFWLSVALVPFFFILAQLLFVFVAGKTFYNSSLLIRGIADTPHSCHTIP